MLFRYLKEVQRLIRDPRQELIDPADLIEYVNEARREVATRTECIRILTPISGSIVSFTISSGGSGYTKPTVSISAPDFPSGTLPYPNGLQAQAVAVMEAGVIVGINVILGGAGYYEPVVTINDPTGTGAVVAPILSGFNHLNQGQEVYPFSSVDLSPFPGVGEIYSIKSVCIIYSNYRYELPCYSFSGTYQSMFRQYPFQYQWVPTVCAQFGRGTSGSFYLYPLPSQSYQMEWDSFCLPISLQTDQDVEAIPDPWRDAVQYYAGAKAFLELQNYNSARALFSMFDQMTTRRSSAEASGGRRVNPYGRF